MELWFDPSTNAKVYPPNSISPVAPNQYELETQHPHAASASRQYTPDTTKTTLPTYNNASLNFPDVPCQFQALDSLPPQVCESLYSYLFNLYICIHSNLDTQCLIKSWCRDAPRMPEPSIFQCCDEDRCFRSLADIATVRPY